MLIKYSGRSKKDYAHKHVALTLIFVLAAGIMALFAWMGPNLTGAITAKGFAWENKAEITVGSSAQFVEYNITFGASKPANCADGIYVTASDGRGVAFITKNEIYADGLCAETGIKFDNLIYNQSAPEASPITVFATAGSAGKITYDIYYGKISMKEKSHVANISAPAETAGAPKPIVFDAQTYSYPPGVEFTVTVTVKNPLNKPVTLTLAPGFDTRLTLKDVSENLSGGELSVQSSKLEKKNLNENFEISSLAEYQQLDEKLKLPKGSEINAFAGGAHTYTTPAWTETFEANEEKNFTIRLKMPASPGKGELWFYALGDGVSAAVDPWWNNDWRYKVNITVTNQAGIAFNDYDVLMTIDTATLVTNGKMISTCNDLRFVDSSNSLIGYWIEKDCNTASTKVWVKVPSLPDFGTVNFTMYYGNAGASSVSSGTDTFLFFDDFDNALDNRWQSDNPGGSSISVANSQVTLTAGASLTDIRSSNSFGINKEVVWNVSASAENGTTDIWWGFANDPTNPNDWIVFHSQSSYNESANGVGAEGITPRLTAMTQPPHKWGIQWNNTADFYVDGAYEVTLSAANMPAGSPTELKVTLAATDSASPQTVTADWVYLRNFNWPEPFYTMGSEEVIFDTSIAVYVSSVNVATGDNVTTYARYANLSGDPVANATCILNMRLPDTSVDGPYTMDYDADSGNYSANYTTYAVGITTAAVTCNKTEYVTNSSSADFTVEDIGTLSTTLNVFVSSTSVEIGNKVTTYARYANLSGDPVAGATCVLNMSLPDSSVDGPYAMTYDAGTGNYSYVDYTTHVLGTTSAQVTCNETGYFTKSNNATFDVTLFGTNIMVSVSNTNVEIGYSVMTYVRYADSSSPLAGATCILNMSLPDSSVDGPYSMTYNAGTGNYSANYTTRLTGATTANIMCSKTGYFTNGSSAGFTVDVDTTPPTCSVSGITELTNASYQHFDTYNILYYNTRESGSFRVAVTATDIGSGIQKVNFPNTVSVGGNDSSIPYTMDYLWNTSSTYSAVATATAYDNYAGLNATCTFFVRADSFGPNGGNMQYNDGYYAAASVGVIFFLGGDSGSGVNYSRSTLERSEATLSGGSCGSYSSWSVLNGNNPSSPYTDNTVQSGKCYKYLIDSYDNVDLSTAWGSSNEAKIDTSTPTITFVPPTPANNAKNTGNSVTINVTVAETVSTVSTCLLQWNGANETMTKTATGAGAICTATKSTVDGTTYTYRVHANDSAGNMGISEQRVFNETGPTSNNPILNATDNPWNRTNANLTCYPQNMSDVDGHAVWPVFNWYKNNVSYAVLNMPFDTNVSGSGTARDYSGYGNGGTLLGGYAPTWNASGVLGGAYEFNGASNYIYVDVSAIFSNPSDFITLSAWIRPRNLISTLYSNIMRQDNNLDSRKLFCFQAFGTQLTLGLNTSSNGYWETDFPVTPSYFTDGNWHHVVYTYNGSNARLYVDGKLNNSIAKSGSIAAETIDLFIGSWGNEEFFNGTIDEVRIYNRSLSADEISRQYIEGINHLNTSVITASETTKGDVWMCQVTPNDGFTDGTTKNSSVLTIRNTPPNPPVLFNPANNSASITDTTPQLNWTIPSDDDSDSLHFHVQVLNDSALTNATVNASSYVSTTGFVPVPPVAHNSGNASYDVQSALDYIQYFWRARTFDGTDYGNWSNVFTFAVTTSVSCQLGLVNISFGNLQPGTAINASVNYAGASSGTLYNLTSTGTGVVNVTHKGTNLTATGGEKINITNVGWQSAATATSNAMNYTGRIPMTGDYNTVNKVATNLAQNNVAYMRYWIEAPNWQAPGAYTGNYTITCSVT